MALSERLGSLAPIIVTGGFALEASARREDFAGVQFLAAAFEPVGSRSMCSKFRARVLLCVCWRAARVFHLAV